MPTNKKRVTTKKKTETVDSKEAGEEPYVLQKPSPMFSKAQFSIAVMISIGISRVLQVKSASIEPSNSVCVTHLGEEACQDDAVLTLLKYKYHTALQTTGLIVAGMLQCWKTEAVLEAYNVLFVLSPLLTGAVALYFT